MTESSHLCPHPPLAQSGCHIVGISGGDPEEGGLSKVVTQGMLFKVIFPALQEVIMHGISVLCTLACLCLHSKKTQRNEEAQVMAGTCL
jgi:hypothetical protein